LNDIDITERTVSVVCVVAIFSVILLVQYIVHFFTLSMLCISSLGFPEGLGRDIISLNETYPLCVVRLGTIVICPYNMSTVLLDFC